MTELKAGGAYCACVFAVGFALGAVRTLVLEPAIGAVAAVLTETPFILTASWIICAWIIRIMNVPDKTGARLIMGAAAFIFLIAAETALGYFLFERSLAEQIAAFGQPQGAIGLAGQIAFACFPVLQLQFTKRR